MTYPGGKAGAGVYQRIINQIPPHDVYVEPFLGDGALLRRKRPAGRNIGIELLGAWPFQHDVSGSGGLGKIGSTKQLPPTLSLQWHILPDSMIQPYIGVGINYTHFFDTKAEGALKGSDLKLGDSWGVAAQLGADIKINDRWFMNADIRYIDIKSKVKLDGERVGTARIDPWVATVSVGYRF